MPSAEIILSQRSFISSSITHSPVSRQLIHPWQGSIFLSEILYNSVSAPSCFTPLNTSSNRTTVFPFILGLHEIPNIFIRLLLLKKYENSDRGDNPIVSFYGSKERGLLWDDLFH